MRCIVTAGPTFEPLDNVRRLTNFSTGRLGAELGNSLAAEGHSVTLLLGEQATYRGELRVQKVESFSTTSDLEKKLRAVAAPAPEAVFHAAAVSDFKFGKVWLSSEEGQLSEIKSGKISTRNGTLLAELVPTSKILCQLRDWFPTAVLIGWKYEVEGGRAAVLEVARRQILECRTNACVANGPAYGDGFGIVTATHQHIHVNNRTELCQVLNNFISKRSQP